MKDIAYIRHSGIDKKRWDASVARASNAMVYAHSWFLDLVSPRWDALIAGDYEAVMPLTWRKKAGIQYLCQPPFTQQLGVFSSRPVSPKQTAAFLDAIPSSFRYVDIFLNQANPLAAGDVNGKVIPRLTHHLDLPSDPSRLSAGYSENLRRNLKKSSSLGLQPEPVPVSELIRLFRDNRGKDIATMGNSEYVLLKKIINAAGPLATLSGIRSGGKLLAGACFLESDREFIFFFSAAGEEGKKTGAMSCIIDSFLRKHGGDSRHLDFEGSMDKNLSRFYKSFGAHEIVYLHHQSNRLPRMLRWLKS